MENNTTYEQEIDLKDLMFAVLRKWRPIILIAVLFGVLLGGYKMYGSISQQNDEEYIEKAEEQYQQDLDNYDNLKSGYEREIKNITQNIEYQTEYLENSILMKISPYDKYTISADFFLQMEDTLIIDGLSSYVTVYNKGLIGAYVSYLNQGIDLSKLAKKMGTEDKYLKELISVSHDDWGQKFSVTVYYSDKAGAEQIFDTIVNDINKQHLNFNSKFGVHDLYIMNQVSNTAVDFNLESTQKNTTDNIHSLQSSLKEKQKALEDLKEPEKSAALSMKVAVKSGIKYAVLGGVLGGFIAVFCICVAFLMTDKISSEKDLKRRYGVKVLASFPREEKKKAFSGVDRWLDKLEGKRDNLTEEARYELMAANLRNYAGDAKKLLVVGTVTQKALSSVADKLGELCKDKTLSVGINLIGNAETVSMLPECDAVILVEERNVSRFGEIEKEIETVYNVKKEIAGAVLL